MAETATAIVDLSSGEVRSRPGMPTWEIALLHPSQGDWTEEQYRALDTNRLIEFKDGCLEFLPMPTFLHQAVCGFLYRLLQEYVSQRKLGWVLFAPLRVRTVPGVIREPDIVYLRHEDLDDRQQPLKHARLVIEVVRPGQESRQRDFVEKRDEYAAAGFPEYWIVDPQARTITVLTLEGEQYVLHGEFHEQESATSRLLPDFEVDVSTCFRAGVDP